MSQTTFAPVMGKNLIAGQWRPLARSAFRARTRPGRMRSSGSFRKALPKMPGKRSRPAGPRFPAGGAPAGSAAAELFDNLAQIVKRETDNLARLMARECGKVVTECRAEVVEGLHMIQYVFGTGRMPMGDVLASEIAEKDAFMRRKPWGVVAVITPWNFPFAVPLWMLGPSLLEGNTVVFKPSEDTPAIGQRLVELFVEAGFPPGVINLVHGEGAGRRGPGATIPTSTSCCSPAATTSASASSNCRREHYDRIVACEMGSKSAVIVCADARLDLAVNARPDQRLQDQRPALRLGRAGCWWPSRCFDRFAEKFVATAQAAAHRRSAGRRQLHRAGDSSRPRSRRSLSYNELARKEGAEVLLDGGRLTQGEHAAAATCRRSSIAWSIGPGVRVHPRGGVRPAPGADPVQDQRGRRPDLQRHASTACRWR